MIEQSCFRWHPLQGVQDGIGPDSWVSDTPSPLTCMYYFWAQMISAWLLIEGQFFSYDILYFNFRRRSGSYEKKSKSRSKSPSRSRSCSRSQSKEKSNKERYMYRAMIHLKAA